MSTKIYSAYRVSKSVDMRNLMVKMREIALNEVANDSMFLRAIWKRCVDLAKRKNLEHYNKLQKVADKQEFAIFQLETAMFESRLDNLERVADCSIEPAIWFDEDYWYLKFFPNTGIAHKIERRIAELPEIEDFHFQDQTDCPDGISEEDFAKRGEKWDELLDEDSSFSSFMTLPIFTHHQLSNLMKKNWYTGTKELYSHLAYGLVDV